MNSLTRVILCATAAVLVACGPSADRDTSEPAGQVGAETASPPPDTTSPVSSDTPDIADADENAAMADPMDAGKQAYLGNCAACHQADGKGLAKAFPPLAESDYLMEDKERSIEIVLNGLRGPIVVNGEEYNSMMMPMSHLSDQTIANILTYVRNSWGNEGEPVTAEEVAAVRGR